MKIKGEITIVTRDKDTLEVKDTRVVENIMSLQGLLSLVRSTSFGSNTSSGDVSSHDNGANLENALEEGLSTTRGFQSSAGIYVSEHEFTKDIIVQQSVNTDEIRGTNLNNPQCTWIEGSNGSPFVPEILEIESRFSAPGTTRTIQTIFWGLGNTSPGSSNLNITAYAALDTPCIQGTSEILDVTYRIQLHDRSSDVPGASISFVPAKQQAYRTSLATSPDSHYLFDKIYSWTRMPPIGDYVSLRNIDNTDSNMEEWVRYIDQIKLRSRSTFNFTVDDNKGRIQRSLIMGSNGAQTAAAEPKTNTYVIQPATDDSFPNKPRQPIHNHSAGAVEPFLDVDFLASGTGVIDVNGDNWPFHEYPQFYRIDITTGGNVGTSAYSLANRNILEFDRDAEPGGNPLWFTDHVSLPWMDAAFGGNETIAGAFGDFNNSAFNADYIATFSNIEEYDADHFVLWNNNDLAVGIININGGDVSLFKSPLSVAGSPNTHTFSGVRQIAADDDGTLWIAAASGGLIRVENPLNIKGGSPATVITQMTNATHGIPSGSDNSCFAVNRGFGGSIWAVFDGAIGETNDGGTSWTLYSDTTGGSPADFIWTTSGGITNNNWAQVMFMRIDESSPDNEMIIWYRNAGSITIARLFNVWWSTAGRPPIHGPGTTSGFGQMAYSDSGLGVTGGMRCSKTGSFWVIKGRNVGTFPAKTRYRSSSTTSFGGTGVEENVNVGFIYDYYGNPYTFDSSGPTGGNLPNVTSTYAVYNAQGEGISRIHWTGDSRSNGLILGMSEASGRANHCIMHGGGFNGQEWEIMQPCPDDDITIDNWNGLSTPFEEFVWTRYNFNQEGSPSVWEAGYHFPATDTSGNGFDGIRHNFFTEDYTFRGRSNIDVSAAAGAGSPPTGAWSGSPANSWTFVASLDGTDKPDFHFDGNTSMTLFSAFDPDTNTNIRCIWRHKDGNISVDDGTGKQNIQSFGATPTLGGSPNLDVVTFVVAGTSITCYLNGTQLGSPALTIAPQSFANPSGNLELRIGSSIVIQDGLKGSPNIAGSPVSLVRGYNRDYKEFYIGGMRNVQLLSNAWSSGDAAAHATSPLGVIGSPGTLVGRWEMNPAGSPNQDLTGREAKLTHDGFEDLVEGITITFGAGSPLGDFDVTDFYTFGMVDGILKDNAISYTATSYLYHAPTSFGFKDIEDSTGSPTVAISGSPIVAVVPSVSSFITEKTLFRRNAGSNFTTAAFPTLRFPGQLGTREEDANANSGNHFTTFQQLDGTGGYMEGRPTSNEAEHWFGLTDNFGLASLTWTTNMDYAFRLFTDGTYSIRQLGGVVGSPTNVAYTKGDLFRITRVEGSPTTFEYRVNNVLVYTSLVTKAPNVLLQGAVQFFDVFGVWYDCVVNHNRPAGILDIGSKFSSTGKYAADFFALDGVRISSTIQGSPTLSEILDVSGSIKDVSGSPVIELVLTDNNYDQYQELAPAPGEVILVSDGGLLVFNAAEQGSTIASSLTLITNS